MSADSTIDTYARKGGYKRTPILDASCRHPWATKAEQAYGKGKEQD